MRSRGRFGMVLDREDGKTAMAHALQRAIVEIDMSRLQVAGQVVQLDREAMVLRGDLDLLGALIEHGLIGAAVAEFQLVRLASQGLPEDLMAQADAEDRWWILPDQLGHGMDGIT